MVEETVRTLLERTDAQARELAALRAEVAALRAARPARPTAPRGRRPLALLLATLAALLPLGLLASGPFGDVPPADQYAHSADIALIADAGITTGCAPGAFCPNEPVTRGQMASFLARTAGLGTNRPVANAALLGGQPASFYQPTGQPIASAANAITLGGFAPGDLARVAHTGPTSPPPPIALTDTFQTIASVTITLPVAGNVLVIGTVAITNGSATGQTQVRLRDTQKGGIAAPPSLGSNGTGPGNAAALTFTPTYLFPIGAAGPRTFVIEGLSVPGGGGPSATNAEIVALFIPFGADGRAPAVP